MSVLLEQLYRLSVNDVQARLLDPRYERADQTAALVNVAPIVFTVPRDHAFILTTFHGEAQPGAGQSCTELALIARPPTGSNKRLSALSFAVGAGVKRHVDFSGEVVVPADGVIIVSGIFDAGAVGNNVIGDITGILIPRGNIERA